MAKMWMEDVTGICAGACDFIQDRLLEFDIQLSNKEEDEVFDAILSVLELKGEGNYKNYN